MNRPTLGFTLAAAYALACLLAVAYVVLGGTFGAGVPNWPASSS